MRDLTTYRAKGMGTGATAVVAASLLAGCVAGASGPSASGSGLTQNDASNVTYHGVETRLLDGDLVNFRVSLSGTQDENDVAAYAECAAAQYALIRGFGFARHVRTKVSHEAGIWRADAVYTISSALPEGLRTLDAEVVTANCRDNKIPTV